MYIAKLLLCVILGFLLAGVWFGFNLIIVTLIQRLKIPWLSFINILFASVLPVFFVYLTLGIYPIQIGGIHQIKVYVIAIVTTVVTAVIVIRKKTVIHKKG